MISEFPLKYKHTQTPVLLTLRLRQRNEYLYITFLVCSDSAVPVLQTPFYQTIMETVRYSTVNRVKSFKRNLSLNIKPNSDQLETTVNCNYEFDYVNFDTMSLADDCDSDLPHHVEEKMLPKVQTKRGVLWQMSGKLFSTWQERFCVLTENSFYSFSKKSASTTKTFRKIKLSDIIDICILTDRGHNTMILKMNNGGKFMFRKSEFLLDWYKQFLSNTSAHIRNNLRKSISMNNLNNCKLSRRPLMGISSLTQSFHK